MISVEDLIKLPSDDWHSLVRELALDLRAETMVLAVKLAESIDAKRIIETGCMRGIVYDGQSTLIFAMLAARLNGRLSTYDINEGHISAAKESLEHFYSFVRWHNIDSVIGLGKTQVTPDLIYLDSYDYSTENPLACQLHQLAEIGAIYGKLSEKSIILMDDADLPGGGKVALSFEFLKSRGWKTAAKAYQVVMIQ